MKQSNKGPEASGIRDTPTGFVNGPLVYNANFDNLREMIEIGLSTWSG
jgi:hypothetical protein